MRPDRLHFLRTVFFAALAAAPFALHAASGEFSFVVGEVTLTKANGQRITPVRGTQVDPGDRIATGATGMVQLNMVDQARLSLRPNTQFLIEQYPRERDSGEGAVLNLLRGTLRTFTGLIASSNRDKFVMRTRVATVGIRGSGNILYACDGKDCDESVTAEAKSGEPLTVNHTIDGSHAVSNVSEAAPGTPAQQGGTSTLITGPGQTVLVAGFQPPRYIPTPRFIADVAVTMAGGAKPAESTAAASTSSSSETRNFSPGDTPAVALSTTTGNSTTTTITPPPPNPTDATGNVGRDPLQLRDIVIAAGSPFLGQALPSLVTTDTAGNLRSYNLYPFTNTGGAIIPTIEGGTARDVQGVTVGSDVITLGRFENASLGFGGGLTPIPGSIHWVMAPSGYPTYLSDVLTGVAAYTLVAATSPTNQSNTVGSIGNAQLSANFTNRTMNFQATITIPSSGSNAGGTWSIGTVASGAPFSLNSFFGSTSDYMTITRGGVSSTSNTNLTGSFEGSFVGIGLTGAILGYGISDRTDGNPGNWNFISGVAVFQGPAQNGAAAYREGRVSDADNQLSQFVRSYATTDRPDEVVTDSANPSAVVAFSAPYARTGPHSTFAIGTAHVVESGRDPDTGLVWGRWGGGTATVTLGSRTEQLFLQSASLHYVFAGTQNGPVALPQTGTATYDVLGATSPTDSLGHTGTMNTATLNANFSARTVDATVNVSINNQTWNGDARGMPIYRDQYFSAYSGTPIQGVPNPVPLVITCQPNCSVLGATGSFDGFFAGRTGQAAGLLYNLSGIQGAIGFRRHGG